MTDQPKWKFVENYGDATPLEHGGTFLFIDETGVYPPELEHVEPDENGWTYTVHRLVMEHCTFKNGVLSDNKYHPDYPVWFAAKDKIHRARHGYDQWSHFCDVAKQNRLSAERLAEMFCDEDVKKRAAAWVMIVEGGYTGWDQFDHYPESFTRDELVERYKPHPEIKV